MTMSVMFSCSISNGWRLETVNQSPELSSSLEILDQSLNQAMDSIRSSVHDLHEEAEDLEHSLKLLLDQFQFCPVSFQYEMSRAIPPELKYCFIGIIKEALSNIIRHSHATQAAISCIEHPGFYQLKLSDNGAPETISSTTSGSGSGIGLTNIRERTEALNGTLQITTDKGFHIFVMIPKENP